MSNYVLYVKTCPGVANPEHFKIGIAGLDTVRNRLASYQNAVGPVWQEQFVRIFLGQRKHVKEAEAQVKFRFKDQISSAEAGFSEWISNVQLNDVLNVIQELREEYFIKLFDPPQEFQPLTMAKCSDLSEWWKGHGVTI